MVTFPLFLHKLDIFEYNNPNYLNERLLIFLFFHHKKYMKKYHHRPMV